jgi:hypothetical protein
MAMKSIYNESKGIIVVCSKYILRNVGFEPSALGLLDSTQPVSLTTGNTKLYINYHNILLNVE